jgi:uncharacterized protein YdeI (YjbR/CyaY-like superfamily)
MPLRGKGWFINVNKKIREQLGLKEGSRVEVSIQKDESNYGLEMPEEFSALLEMDADADKIFHALTPGKQRTLIYVIANVKNEEKRIQRAITVAEHLKRTAGKINYRELADEMKQNRP